MERQADHVLQLIDGDQYRRSGGKADHDGMRDEVDQSAQARQSQQQLEQSGQQGQRQYVTDIIRAARLRERAHHAEDHDGERRGGTGHQMSGRAEQRGHDGRDDGGVQAVLWRQAGDQGEGHALRQHDDGAGQSREQIRPQGGRRNPAQPAQEWEQLDPAALRRSARRSGAEDSVHYNFRKNLFRVYAGYPL